ncbi:fasciclin domain-containing protein [Ilumatobacter sp.]|jgi:transforming growth factor-beta-induced protein|uniref:fasciclin domain-containing protein n=1 Tax=Ilumatobacter sp. TaxID=1967498 RepID=UPI003750D5CE|nr:fasciclin domain-containing protein [Ilumatobacter sp.]
MKRTTTTRLAAGLVAGVLALTACGSDGNDADVATTEAEAAEAAEVGTIVDVAIAAGTFDTLVAAVSAAGLAETLSGEGPFTVFAPTDDAFAALPAGLVDALLLPENEAALVAVLTYHVLGAEVPSSDVATGAVATLQGEEIELVAGENGVTVNGANVIAVDVEASNGVIHVIDSVLVPPSIDATALLVADAMESEAMEEEMEVGTIVDVAVEAGSFNTLVAAVTAADLAETLSGEGPFTVFAPTDEAFAALPAGLVDALLLPENKDALVAVLTYHVLGAEVPSSDVATGAVATLQGEEIELVASDDGVTVNGANVIAVDVEASNGVIHVIDAVLVPPSIDPSTLLS